MVIGKNRATKLVVDLSAIKHNIAEERKLLDDQTQIFAVVKANAYGHGLLRVAQTVIEAGVTGLCVAILDEALYLRQSGITVPILVLGITEPEKAVLASQNDISLTVGSVSWMMAYQSVIQAQSSLPPLKVHLALDTGMGRIGFTEVAEFQQALTMIKQPEFIFEGLFTHFATADEKDRHHFDVQVNRWQNFMQVVETRPKYVHVANSATSLWHLKADGNMIRFGAAMYGMNPSGSSLPSPYELQQAASLETKLSFVKQIHTGDKVSYGATYTAKQDEWVGSLALGYADGYPRRMQGFYVLVDGQKCEIIGRVCMDQLMIRLPKKYPIGTKVTVMGKNGQQQITSTDIAEYAGTINYEIMTQMAERVDRQYL
ncbi:alanine racemase [Paucilactobacillus sp. N302-9]